MLSGIIFILISWLVVPKLPEFPEHFLWLSIVLTVYGALKIMWSLYKVLYALFSANKDF